MRTYLPSLQKSISANRRFGKPGLLAAVALLCTGIALFAASNNGGKLNSAHEARDHKITLANAKKTADHNARGNSNTVQGAPISVSYSSSNFTFHVGTTILLTPASSGVAAPAPGVYTSPVVLGSGLNFSQNGLTLDAAGNMYVNDQDGGFGNVKKITADGSSTTIIGSGFLTQSGNVAVDKAGNVYVADQANVWKIPASGSPLTYGTPAVINNTFSRPFGVAADTAGNIYVTNIGGGVYKMSNDGNNKVRIDDGTINNGSGITVDATGNVYVVDFSFNALYEIPAGGSPQVQLANGFSFPRGVAVDGAGNIYIDDESASTIYTVPPGGGTPVAAVSGITNAVGVAVDAMYNVYVALQGSAGINKFSPTGGYFISPALPSGLNFNNTTGVITGTPTAITAEKSYIISAYNSDNSVSDTLHITVNPHIPVPVLSYANPNVDTLRVTIATIVPSATGVDTPGYAPYKLVANGFLAPLGIASDTSGNIYVADKGNNLVKKVPADGSATVSLGSGFSSPSGVAVDAAGFIYVADAGNSEVKKMSADGLTITSIGSGFTSPVAVAVDGAGNVYVADAGAGAVYKILASDGSTVTLSGTFDTLTSIAVDKTGQNIYVSDGAANSVYKVSPGCGCPEDLGFNFNFPTGVALDPQGNLYVADADIPNTTGLVYKGDGKSSNFVNTGSTFLFPSGVAVDPSGNLFVTDAAPGILYEIVPSGGYFLATTLPKGLKFNDTTGVISGKPAALSAATDYKVFAYNAGGGTPALVNIEVVLPPLPTLTYNTSNTYTAGTAITPLVPTSAYIAKTSYASTPAFIGSGFNAPRGTAVDKSGNVFVADSLNNAVKMIPAGGGAPVPWGSGFSNPTGVAVDSLGFVYVSDYGNSAIKKIAPDGITVTSIGTPITSPSSVAVDAAGNVYATDLSTGFIYEIKASDGSTVTLNSSFALPFPTGIAANADYIYVSDGFFGAVLKFKQGGAIPDLIGPFNYPSGVAVDASGNMYVSDEGDSTIYRVPANGHTVTNLATTGLSGPEGLSVDGKGNIYVADVNNNTVGKVVPNGGFYINRPLPTGLSFNSKTGSVQGTPTSASPAKDYTVTGYNSAGAVSALFSIEVDLPPLPTLSYTGPNNYTVGNPIVPLTPSAANVSSIAYTSAPTVVSSGPYTFIAGVATDKAGNVYVVDAGANTVTKLPAGGGSPVNIGSGFDGPQNVAVDAAGNVYVADAGNSSIKKIPGGTGAPVTIGSGFDYPVGVAVDAAGNVFVADESSGSNGAVYKIPGGSGTPVLLTTDITNPTGIAVDASGTLFVIDAFAGALYELVGGTGTPVTIGPLFNSPEGVTVDNGGNVYVTDAPLSIVDIIPVSGGPVTTVDGLGIPFGIALDGAGNLYISDANDNTLKKVTPAGGLFISPMLPAGLLFNGTTGTISGTPTIISPATNYTVTGYNPGGSAHAIVNIRIGAANDALLSILATTPKATLTVVPGADYRDYTTTVSNLTSSIKITPTAHSSAATITVNGVAVTSGTASDPIQLNLDTNTIYATVTASDGITKKTYAIKITRLPSSNATLSILATTPKATLTVMPGADYRNFVTTVSNLTSSIRIMPTAVDSTATITVNGVPVVSGATSDPIQLNVDTNTVYTTVTAADGTTKKTYSIKIIRLRSKNAVLTNLKIIPKNAVTVLQGSDYRNYEIAVANSTNSISVIATTQDGTATLTVNGFTATSGLVFGPVSLNADTTTIYTTVTAGDGTTKKTYAIKIKRLPSENALLTNLKIIPKNAVTIVQGSDYRNYEAAVTNSTNSICIIATTQDGAATLTVNGVTATSGASSAPVQLNADTTTVFTTVTAGDGVTKKTYAILVTRQIPSIAVVQHQQQESLVTNSAIVVHQNVSPNGDGNSDALFIEGIAAHPDNKLQIMSRSGALVYEAKGYDNATKVFDGHSSTNGKLQQPGTYFYSLEYKDGNEVKHKTGFIVLRY